MVISLARKNSTCLENSQKVISLARKTPSKSNDHFERGLIFLASQMTIFFIRGVLSTLHQKSEFARKKSHSLGKNITRQIAQIPLFSKFHSLGIALASTIFFVIHSVDCHIPPRVILTLAGWRFGAIGENSTEYWVVWEGNWKNTLVPKGKGSAN